MPSGAEAAVINFLAPSGKPEGAIIAKPTDDGSRRDLERKIFWIVFMCLGLVADFLLPAWWALGATVPIAVLSWWVAYRSEWF